MRTTDFTSIRVEQRNVDSVFLKRLVIVDFYIPDAVFGPGGLHLLLINDGQDLVKMNFTGMLEGLLGNGAIQPLMCVGIHAGEDRRMEYGTAKVLDYIGRGAKAAAYNSFVINELLPLIEKEFSAQPFKSRNIAGFSLGGLSAIDITWNHPQIFTTAGIFSGSLWWRSKDVSHGYDEHFDRIMHRQIRERDYHAGLRFYFTTGSLDEVADRNNNGIIDSIDDTVALIDELQKKGYTHNDIAYKNYEDGRHDVETWGRAMPGFLHWGWQVQ
ncbi:MAG TPA: alpha/beta hydrolase-fold protein [Flavisolibacter sp.]|nr:alpha/beta hydrolase-fold protein [Flavisolibacter sp.]